MSLALVPVMAELIILLSCSLLAPMASATCAHWWATMAAAEATAASLALVDASSCFKFSAAMAARAAAMPALLILLHEPLLFATSGLLSSSA